MKSWLNRFLGKKTQHTFPVVWDTQLASIYARLEQACNQPQPLAWDNSVLENQPLGDSDEAFWAPGALEGPSAENILSALH